MLTPGYSITATERVLPRLALDFTTGVLDSRVTVTRALNTATRVNSSGYIETVNANLPRFDYSPTSVGTPRGLLIEETRANILLQSQDFSTSWSRTNSNVSVDAGVSPDGTSNADLFIPTVNPGTIFQGNAKAASSLTYTFSIYVKPSGFTTFRMFVYGSATTNRGDAVFSLTGNGTVSSAISAGTFTNTSATIAPAGNGYYRCTLTTTSNTDTAISVTCRYDGTVDGVSGFLLYGAQLEQATFATSYIPTTTTSLTRNADAVSMTGTNFSDWFNATEGTFSIDCIINTKPAAQILMEMSDGTSANKIQYQRDTGSNVLSYVAIVSSSITVNLQKASAFVNDAASITAAYKLDNYGVAVNGGATTTDTLSGVPTVDRMRIGATVAGTALSNGWYQNIFYYPQRLTNSEIQAFSK